MRMHTGTVSIVVYSDSLFLWRSRLCIFVDWHGKLSCARCFTLIKALGTVLLHEDTHVLVHSLVSSLLECIGMYSHSSYALVCTLTHSISGSGPVSGAVPDALMGGSKYLEILKLHENAHTHVHCQISQDFVRFHRIFVIP